MRDRSSPSEMLIRQRVHALARSLPGAQKGDAKLVHRARVATRRLREALPLLLPGSRGRKLERKVRRLTRALGPVRELDVALQALDELHTAGDVPAAGIARLTRAISQERQRLHAEMCREVARVDLDKLRRRVAVCKGKLDVGGRAARRAVRLRAAIENAAGIYLPDRLHAVRIAVKKLRYALELTRASDGAHVAARIRRLKEAQDLLGRMHDREVLIARVRAVQGSSRAPNLRLSADLDRLVRRLETECRQIHGHYTTRRTKLLAICDQTLTAPADAWGAKSRASSAA